MPSTLAGLNPSGSFDENVVNVAPQLLDANVAFSATGSLAGARLVVSGLLAEDRVSVLHQGGGAGQIGVSGSTISYGGVVIGAATGGGGSNLTVTFNSAVTAAAVDAVIERLAYGNISNAPTATRTLIVNVIDSSGASVNAPLTPQFVELAGSANPFNGIDVGSSSAPSFIDLDSDGDLDLVVGEGTLRVYLRDGNGRYTELTGSANPLNGISGTPSFTDLDGDTDFDLVVGESGGTLRTWQNTGTGFSPLTGAANPFNGLDVGRDSAPCFVDFDGDGDIDRLVGEWYGNINVWRNDGTIFTELTGDTNPFQGWLGGDSVSVTFIDLEGDGDLDPIVGASVGWLWSLQNNGGVYQFWPTGLNPFLSVDVGSASRPFAVDLDSDADLDLVVGSYDGTLRVWQNTTIGATISVVVNAEEDPTASNDVISASPLNDTVDGLAGDDRIDGLAGNDSLLGMSGNDTLTGDAGADTLMGGAGNDLYVISDTLDVIIETANGGADTIITSVSMSIPNDIETLRIATDVSGVTLTGGAGNDMLVGNGLTNTFNGGAGDDVILAGNVTLADIYALFAT
jgi:Ca2+-binding RTX toxin-like protein